MMQQNIYVKYDCWNAKHDFLDGFMHINNSLAMARETARMYLLADGFNQKASIW